MLTSFFFPLFDADHSLRGTSLPGLEVGRCCNQGSCTKLPVSFRHSGDGGPRGRALPAGCRLLHSAPASGRNILVIFCIFTHVTRGCLHYTPFFLSSLRCLILSFDSYHFSGMQRSTFEPWHECSAVTKLGFDCWLCPPTNTPTPPECWFAFVC